MKHSYLTTPNTVLHPSLLVEAAVLDGQSSLVELLKLFVINIYNLWKRSRPSGWLAEMMKSRAYMKRKVATTWWQWLPWNRIPSLSNAMRSFYLSRWWSPSLLKLQLTPSNWLWPGAHTSGSVGVRASTSWSSNLPHSTHYRNIKWLQVSLATSWHDWKVPRPSAWSLWHSKSQTTI